MWGPEAREENVCKWGKRSVVSVIWALDLFSNTEVPGNLKVQFQLRGGWWYTGEGVGRQGVGRYGGSSLLTCQE